MHEHSIEEIWPAAERVLVLVDGDPGAGTVLRNAWRLASALHAELVAAVVTPPGGLSRLSDADRRAIERNVLMAEDLGARTVAIETADPAAGIVEMVHAEHVTLLVMRYVRQVGWRVLKGESLIDSLMEKLDNVDIHLVEASGQG